MGFESLNSIVFFLVAIAVLVTFHEFGHFIVARWAGVRVLRFSVGFGRSIWKRQSHPEATEYVIGLIPLGGYVKMLDEREGPVSTSELNRSFNRKPLSSRALIVAAGPAANLLLAVLLYWIIGVLGSQDLDPVIGKVAPTSHGEAAGFQEGDRLLTIDGRAVTGWSEQRLYLLNQIGRVEPIEFGVRRMNGDERVLLVDVHQFSEGSFSPSFLTGLLGLTPSLPDYPATIGDVVEGGPAARAGILKRDQVRAVNGMPISDWPTLVQEIASRPGETLRLTIDRQGMILELAVVAERVETSGEAIGRIGVFAPEPPALDDFLVNTRYGLIEGLIRGAETTWIMSAVTLKLFGQMISGRASTEHLSGPIAIARYAGESASLGLSQFLAFLAVLSVSLGLINLLPIPVLDGGHLVYFLIEAITRRPVSERLMVWGQQVGISLIILLMGLAFYNDLSSLFS